MLMRSVTVCLTLTVMKNAYFMSAQVVTAVLLKILVFSVMTSVDWETGSNPRGVDHSKDGGTGSREYQSVNVISKTTRCFRIHNFVNCLL
jgi:hypothetical protein